MAGQQKILVKLLLLFSSLLFKSFSKLLIKISFMPVTLKSHTLEVQIKSPPLIIRQTFLSFLLIFILYLCHICQVTWCPEGKRHILDNICCNISGGLLFQYFCISLIFCFNIQYIRAYIWLEFLKQNAKARTHLESIYAKTPTKKVQEVSTHLSTWFYVDQKQVNSLC